MLSRIGGDGRYEDTCLPDSFRAMGLKVAFSGHGPFFALRDGNRMLAPLHSPRHTIRRIPELDNELNPGRYVLYAQNHFCGLRVFDDGSCHMTTSHRTQDNLCIDVADVNLELWEAVFVVEPLAHGTGHRTDDDTDEDKAGGSHRMQASDCEEPYKKLVHYIDQYVIFHRILHIRSMALTYIQELVTCPGLWLHFPNPLHTQIDKRTWRHFMDCFEDRARKVTEWVDPQILVSGLRPSAHGPRHVHSISDVDRAVKRVGAWARIMIKLLDYDGTVSLLSPVDPAISKRIWEKHLFDIRQSLTVLTQTVPSCVDTSVDTSSKAHEQDYLGGVTEKIAACGSSKSSLGAISK
ncbi:unnamed protein product [Symbiodinium sp. CCMP2592]|nr:unnamed protein product [Symbiodinium sp. CCMP2592]